MCFDVLIYTYKTYLRAVIFNFRGDMSFQKGFFTAIDKVMDGAQNRRVRKKLAGRDYILDRDIVYDEGEPQVCRLDICRLPDEGKYPVMFYLHGGGFVAGDKHYRRALSAFFALLGYLVVNVNYGLGPEYKCPQQHRQLISALNWLEDNAETFNIDLSRLAVGGDSAGAYYASVLACICADNTLQQRIGAFTRLKFGAAVLNCGVYDMNMLMHGNIPFGLGPRVLEDIAGIKQNEMEGYEWNFLCDVPALVNGSFPATFLTYAQKDIFCGGQSEALIAAFKKNGVYYDQFHSRKYADNHCFSLNWSGRAARKNNAYTADFLNRFANGTLMK